MRVAALLSPVLRFYQVVLYPVARPSAKVLNRWLGPEGVQYIAKSIGAGGSDIDRFAGRGAINFLALDSRRVGEKNEGVDANDYCVRPIITHDPKATLEQTLMSANLAENKSHEKGLILLWGSEKRIIAPAVPRYR